MTHAQREVRLHRGLVFQGLETETNKASLNDWYSCLYVQGLQPTNHLGNHSTSGPPASKDATAQRVVWRLMGRLPMLPSWGSLALGNRSLMVPEQDLLVGIDNTVLWFFSRLNLV